MIETWLAPSHLFGDGTMHGADAVGFLLTVLTGVALAAGLVVFALGRTERTTREQPPDSTRDLE